MDKLNDIITIYDQLYHKTSQKAILK